MATRILIADDHVVIRKMLKALLETREGWEVCGEAANGREAVTKAQELKPDLMIMDLAMPIMDGIRASRELSRAMPTVPIVMHTLHYSLELEVEAKKAGIRQVVAKVDSGERLMNAIEALVNPSAWNRSMEARRESASNTSESAQTPRGASTLEHPHVRKS